MHLHAIVPIALLAGSALAKPIAHHPHPIYPRQFTNTSLPAITQTSTDASTTTSIVNAPNVTATLLNVLTIQGAPVNATTVSSSATFPVNNGTFATITPAPNSSTIANGPLTESTITTTRTTTLTYTIGTGASLTTRTLVVTKTETEVVTCTETPASSTLSSKTTSTLRPLSFTRSSSSSPTPSRFAGVSTLTTSTSSATSSSTSVSPSATPSTAAGALCEGTNNSTYTDPQGISYNVYCDQAYTVTAVGSVKLASTSKLVRRQDSETIQSCMDQCDASPDCVAITETSSDCVMYSSVAGITLKPASGSTSARKALNASNTNTTSTTIATSTASTSTCNIAAPPAATQTGVVSGCTKWYIAVSGDYCYTVAERFGISVDTLMAWNPAVDAPSCPNMLAGDAYCVATCNGPSSTAAAGVTTLTTASLTTISTTLTSSSLTLTLTSTSSLTAQVTPSYVSSSAAPTSTATGADVYHFYQGDGSIADGWPAESQWVDFDSMFAANTANMQASCAQWGVPDDSDTEIANIKTAIQAIATATGVDERFILAIIMQESTGCVRVITTEYSVFNPGLMQSHNGTGSCNTNNANIAVPGVSDSGTVQTPCPYSEIHQMIEDGTAGTSSGDGLEQCLQKQGSTGSMGYYRAARMYNGGSIASDGNLGEGCCTACYASDIANRLTGWVHAPSTCTL